MPIEKIYAHTSCSNIEASGDWYERLFGRPHDEAPMDGLREWHHGTQAGLQLFVDPEKVGNATVTLIVSDLKADRASLIERGIGTGEIETGDYVCVLRLADPDGNLVVLAEPKRD